MNKPIVGDLVFCRTRVLHHKGFSVKRVGLVVDIEPCYGGPNFVIMDFIGKVHKLPESLWQVERWGLRHPPPST